MRLFMVAVCATVLSSQFLSGQDASPSDSKAQIRTARDLSKQGSTAIPQLEPLLKDQDAAVRLEAVDAVVKIGTQHSLEPLVAALADNDGDVQIHAVDGLVNFYVPGYVQSGISGRFKRIETGIKGKFTDTNSQVIDSLLMVRPNVIEGLGRVTSSGVTMEARAHAARALGILRGRAALPDLLTALRSKDDNLIYESLIALQKIRDFSGGQGAAVLVRDLQERIQLTAIETVGLLQYKPALPDLRDIFQHSRKVKVRRMAMSSIAMLADDDNRQLFADNYTNRDEGIRTAALEGFARLKSQRDVPSLKRAFTEENSMAPRLAAAFALVSDGQNEISEFSPLQYLVNTLNSQMYQKVAEAYLIELTGDADVRRQLYPAIPKATKDEKIMLAGVLMHTGDRESIPYLEKLSMDVDPEVAKEGIRASSLVKARNP